MRLLLLVFVLLGAAGCYTSTRPVVAPKEEQVKAVAAVEVSPEVLGREREVCAAYQTQFLAQVAFNADRAGRAELDADKDGVACEHLPGNSAAAKKGGSNSGSSGQAVQTGPRGGKYVITKSGKKRYLSSGKKK